MEEPDGRGRIAVAIAAVALVGAIIAAFVLLSGGSSSHQQEVSDANAKANLHSAQIALETYATEQEGSYAGATVATLKDIEPTISDNLELVTADASYTLTIPSQDGNTFTISNDHGATSFTCEREGEGGCPFGGEWQ